MMIFDANKHFFGKPCRKDKSHILDGKKSIRYLKGNLCIECTRERARKQSKKRNEEIKGFRKYQA